MKLAILQKRIVRCKLLGDATAERRNPIGIIGIDDRGNLQKKFLFGSGGNGDDFNSPACLEGGAIVGSQGITWEAWIHGCLLQIYDADGYWVYREKLMETIAVLTTSGFAGIF